MATAVALPVLDGGIAGGHVGVRRRERPGGMICCPLLSSHCRATVNSNSAPAPGSENVQSGDVPEQLPNLADAEFPGVRSWHRWAPFAGRGFSVDRSSR
jgi:hypothetical protein